MSNLNLPTDPMILLSFVNTKLRDFYPSLDSFCEDADISRDEIIQKLSAIGYAYNTELNKFV